MAGQLCLRCWVRDCCLCVETQPWEMTMGRQTREGSEARQRRGADRSGKEQDSGLQDLLGSGPLNQVEGAIPARAHQHVLLFHSHS